MTRKFAQATVLAETRELVDKIAAATNEKKTYIYDKAIQDYAQKKQLESQSTTH